MLYDSINMKCPEKAYAEIESRLMCIGAGVRGNGQ